MKGKQRNKTCCVKARGICARYLTYASTVCSLIEKKNTYCAVWKDKMKKLSAEGAQSGEWPVCDRRISRSLLEAECGGSTLLHGE